MSHSANNYRALADSVSDIIMIVGGDRAVKYVSPSVERWLGYTPREFTGLDPFALLHRDDAPRIAALFAQAVADPEYSRPASLRARHKDGSWRLFELTGRNRLADPAVAGLVICARDVTEQRQASEQLAREHALLQGIMASSPEAIVVTELDGTFVDCNERTLQLIGAPARDALRGKKFADFVEPADAKRLRHNMEKLLRQRMTSNHQYAVRTGDGRTLAIEVSSGIIGDGAGEPRRIVAIARDITARQREEQRRLALEKAVQTMQLGLTISDPGGTILYTNAAEAALHGYTTDELVGQSVRIFAPDWLWHKLSMDQEKRMKRYGRESVNVRKDGTEFPVQILSDVVKNERGEPVAIVTTSEDISNRKRMDNLLKKREEYFKTLIENAQDIITIANGSGVIKFISPAVTRILG
ncbi:MAG TPA: PAS domain S-box protein, partial [Candidatus Edwardsbacteria bacterium]|nr:PAS domain S-box protein [Candidatus Edwardsbacteria bacterium]